MDTQSRIISAVLYLAVASQLVMVSSVLTDDETKLLFAVHNKVRSDVWISAADMQLMKYSPELQKRAEAWANLNFNFIHPNATEYADVGVGLGYTYDTTSGTEEALGEIMNQMVAPGDTYDFESNKCDKDCQYYMQIISASVRSFGCTLRVYNAEEEYKSYRLVCLYSPRYVCQANLRNVTASDLSYHTQTLIEVFKQETQAYLFCLKNRQG
ncbi:unnamed protein product [Dibothriocephalus latus]|uniref:SCP domain-containing protein n=1 Tax=Dibothriocephalus latus TaxID=60516 RepID=A0A3P7L4U6_DIBLA|nr:unnamed protein product [Dibothriocephalus latus]